MKGFPSRRTRLLWLALCLGLPLCATGAEVSGVLRDNQGNGLADIDVTATAFSTDISTQLVATTDVAGRFSFAAGPGSWDIYVAADELNARGYFSAPYTFLFDTDQSVLRLITRKLDFTHRINGRVINEAHQPLAGHTVHASISENDAQFETNAVTDVNGAFTIAAVPAVWSFYLDSSPGWYQNVLGERLVEVEFTNVEKEVTFIAPTATSTISVTVSNLAGSDVVASAEAFGATYRLTQPASYFGSAIDFRVFNGVWTISVTNIPFGVSSALPAPVSVAVTNSIVPVVLTMSGPTQQVQRVRTVTASGTIASNVSVAASSAGQPFGYSSPLPLLGTPGVYDLQVIPGKWTLTANSAINPDWIGWLVSYDVTILSNATPPEVTLVFPGADIGPQIFGTVRTPAGSGVPSIPVSCYMLDDGTNYSTLGLITDTSGHFDVRVIPGRWAIQLFAGFCPQRSFVVVSNEDAQVDFEVLLPFNGAPVSVNHSAVYEDGSSVSEASTVLQSGFDYLALDGPALLRPGIWSVSLQQAVFNTPYTLFPSFAWQLSSGAATNLVCIARQTSARIEGRLRDDQGRLLLSGYAAAWTSVDGTNFWSYGAIASGYFSLNVFPGEWQVGAAVSHYPSVGVTENLAIPGGTDPFAPQPTTYYTTPPLHWVCVSNDLARCDFVTTNLPIAPPVSVAVTVLREDGTGVSKLRVFTSTSSETYGQQVSTDDDGMALFSVAAGRMTIYPWDYDNPGDELPGDESLLWPTLSLDVTAPSNQVVLILRQASTCIPGTISNPSSLGILPPVWASSEVDGTNYTTSACSDRDGHYCLPALPGLWTVQIYDGWLNDFGIQSLTPRDVIVPMSDQAPPLDLVLARLIGDFREARLKNPVMLQNGGLRLELSGQASLSWRVERSHNLIDWTPFALETTVNGSFVIEDAMAASDPTTFYRAVWIR